MAFTGNFMCTSFKQQLLTATHDFTNTTGSTFKLALYDNSASFTAATTAYTAKRSWQLRLVCSRRRRVDQCHAHDQQHDGVHRL
jgi:hypothetical protein